MGIVTERQINQHSTPETGGTSTVEKLCFHNDELETNCPMAQHCNLVLLSYLK